MGSSGDPRLGGRPGYAIEDGAFRLEALRWRAMPARRPALLALPALLLAAGIGCRSEPARPAPATSEAAALPAPRTHYRGREIATTMHWRGAEWLLRETRETEEHGARMLQALDVQPGWTVCDLGCGNGYHTLPLARLVGPEGRVYAVDIQPEMLELLAKRAAAEGVTNVERVLGGTADSGLPDACCDLVLLVDVYHELSYPDLMLAAIRRALKPGGRVVLVEFRAEDPDVPIKPLHKMSKAQIVDELEANGFALAFEFDRLPWQHLMAFAPAAR
jgi:SAM-dependent methyltransferase